MKANQKKALHQKSVEELNQELIALEKELTKARLELAAQKLEDTSKPKRLVKNVARIKTIITEKKTRRRS
jgi:large subunit ribosomal protein L29